LILLGFSSVWSERGCRELLALIIPSLPVFQLQGPDQTPEQIGRRGHIQEGNSIILSQQCDSHLLPLVAHEKGECKNVNGTARTSRNYGPDVLFCHSSTEGSALKWVL
jgi:hypothetical protein